MLLGHVNLVEYQLLAKKDLTVDFNIYFFNIYLFIDSCILLKLDKKPRIQDFVQ